MANEDFPEIRDRLRGILSAHVPPLVVAADGPAGYTVNVNRPDVPEPRRYFAGVRVGKSYVSFYLMPVYAFPDMLNSASPGLLRRMQGKSCFNFARVDETLFRELAALTALGLERYKTVPL